MATLIKPNLEVEKCQNMQVKISKSRVTQEIPLSLFPLEFFHVV